MFRTNVHVRVLQRHAEKVKENFPLQSGDRIVNTRPSENGCADITFYVDAYTLRESQAKFLWEFYTHIVESLPELQREGYAGKTLFQYWTSAVMPPVQYIQALTYPSWRQRLTDLEQCS
jgi:hypothetical protein